MSDKGREDRGPNPYLAMNLSGDFGPVVFSPPSLPPRVLLKAK